jgi:hypothetical protein
MDINKLRQIRVDLTSAKKNIISNELEIEPNPCWEGYEPIGLKDDGSPNCVPIKDEQSKQKFVIPTPSESETQDEYIGRCISSIVDEYGQEQAAGICYGQWEKK